MTQPSISVQNVGKQFHLGMGSSYNTLRDHIAHGVKWVASGFRGRAAGLTGKGDDTFWALKDVSFDVAQGEVIGIIGRNGAGKSTLLKILSQITEPTEGLVHIRGRVASLLEVGTGFHSELTGRENIFLNGAILGMSKAEINRKFDEIVAFSEVEKFLDSPVKHYSSGMSMRLAFGVAAHLEPEILLVDEVLAVGDAAFQQKCMGKMDEVAKAGRTVLFVSHNMAAMQALCTKGLLLEKGRLKNSGPIGEMVNLYIGEATASSRRNLFCAEHRSGDGRVLIEDVELECDGVPNMAVAGGKISFVLSYTAESPNLPIQFRLGVFDTFRNRLLALDSGIVENLPQTFPSKGKVRVEFPEDFCLSPGNYTLNIAACLHKQNVDFVQDALSFVIEEGDFFRTGRLPYGKASVLCRTRWTLVL